MSANAQNYIANTYGFTLTHSAHACLDAVAALGFREVELMMHPGHAWPDEMSPKARRDFATKIETLGLRIRSLNMPNVDLNIAAAAERMRAYSIDFLSDVLALAGDLGVPDMVLGPGKPNPLLPAPKQDLMDRFFAALDILVPRANEAGVRLIVENMPFGFLPTADDLIAALDAYGDDRIAVVYDIANAVFAREDPNEGLARVGDRLALVHLSDTGLDAYAHAPVGAGVVPFADVAQYLAALDYRRGLVLEIISDEPEVDLANSATALDEMGWRTLARRQDLQ